MGLPIHVEPYAQYRADERPRRFELDGHEYRIYCWDREWRTPDAWCFVVRSEGKLFEIHYHRERGEWRLQESYDGAELFGRPNLEVRTVDRSVARKVQWRILGCESCHPQEAWFPLSCVLNDELGVEAEVEYLLPGPIVCLQCGAAITESTLVEYE